MMIVSPPSVATVRRTEFAVNLPGLGMVSAQAAVTTDPEDPSVWTDRAVASIRRADYAERLGKLGLDSLAATLVVMSREVTTTYTDPTVVQEDAP
ncbi:hypothetical protein SEA_PHRAPPUCCINO_160 [Mycobacterium phage Phrappuccino]|uniref:Uncharacterized protein n=1 Tax=Mycobacterium phage Phrappuccino TaxID=2591223 RepID=A0A514DE00_9CAUD|nr:hypothetical protein KHQ87_gp160 [Mycobacterium phage Phrappuccino]QDH91835.1 hypothetical protein SEA_PHRAPPUCCINO_160 [Mycobacterium phage Phrappuccino]QIQ63277.1 hypothetical protein SEA_SETTECANDELA_160 [Mycobacterium phage Settecandela]